ncbi:MAG: response regulator [Gammaproteobacteria bacterium]|nr:MAG: response regulator [Gammaproteobacteria bacterium]
MVGIYRKFSSKWVLLFGLSLFLIIFSISGNIGAAPDERVVRLNEDTDVIELGKHSYFYLDETGELTYEDVSKPEFNQNFKPVNTESLNLGFGDMSVWVKFSIFWEPKNVSEIDERHWLIEQNTPYIDYVEFYDVVPNGELNIHKSGDKVEFGAREYDYPLDLFSTSTLPYIQKTLYMRFETKGAMRFQLRLRSLNNIVSSLSHHQLVMGVVLGVMLVMAVYNFSLSAILKDSLYLHFSLYIFALLLFRSVDEGYFHQYILTSSGIFLNRSASFFACIAMIFFIKFFTKFILQEKDYSWLKVVSNLMMFVVLLVTAMLFILHDAYYVGSIAGMLGLFLVIASILLSGYFWYAGIKAAKYFLLGNVLLLLCVAFIVLLDNALIHRYETIAYAQYIGIIGQILLLSYALGQKIADERRIRQIAQQRSVEYLRQYEAIYNNVADGLFRYNADLIIESVNPALLECFECESLQEFREYFRDIENDVFVSRKDYASFMSKLDKLVLNGASMTFEVHHKKKNSGTGWGLCTVKLIYDEHAKGRYYEGSFLDITDKKEKEAAEVGMAKAEAIADAKGRFLAIMSHEIRTPMNAIIGFTDIALSRGEMQDKTRDYFQRIRHSSDILLGIINDILDFSKIEAGMLELERSKFLLKDLLKKVHDMFAEEAREKKLGFDIDVDPGIPAIIIGDQLRLSQIIINLISNAIKFTEEGDITLKLIAQERRDSSMLVRFEVVDTGIGINHHDEEYLFEAFTQADESTTREFGGSGLGLSICKKLVDLHGGSIGCKSMPGNGSLFWFEIDIESPELQDSQVEPFPEILEGLPRIDGKRVLVVEDNKINQVIASELLSDIGAEAVIRDDGFGALEFLGQETVDLVLMDLLMPKISGKETLGKIKEAGYSIPVVALTADALSFEPDEIKSSGFDGFITKPIDIEEFAVKLSALLN